MQAESLGLNDAQRRAIGVRLESMRRLLLELRAAGLDSERIGEMEEVMRDVHSETRAIVPEPPRNTIQAALAQLWVGVMEIRSRQIKVYGQLDESAAAFLDEQSKRLDELVTQLIEEHETRRTEDALRSDSRSDRR